MADEVKVDYEQIRCGHEGPALFAVLYLRTGFGLPFYASALFTSALITLGFIDARHQILPDAITYPGIALGLLYGRPAGHGRRRRDALGQARDVLGEVGLGEKAGEIARRLSLGDLKRLELATAVATQPALLLVDEILAGQSPTSAHQILGFLSGLRAKGVAVCLIEHRLQTLLPVADQVVALHQGRVIADGGPEAVIKSPAVLEAYLGEPVP